MSRPVILIFADTEDERDALANEIIDKLQLRERSDPPKIRSTKDDFGKLILSSLASHY